MDKLFDKIKATLAKGKKQTGDLSDSDLDEQSRDPERYEQEKKIARSADVRGRITLAKSSKTHQEILYYLAQNDDDEAVRLAVAENAKTPVQASPILAGDSNEDVRFAFAERLVEMLPDLDMERQSQLYAFAVQALGALALDEVLKIRVALSSALKDHLHAPPDVVNRLARDIEHEVAAPILKFCTAVSNDVLLEILKAHPASWAVQAIAGRHTVPKKISKAVINTKDRKGGGALIQNDGAQISKETLEQIIARAKDYPEWQTHLATRANLPPKMAKKLAEYADRSVRRLLMEYQEFDKKTATEISEIFKRRIDFAGEKDAGGFGDSTDPAERVRQLLSADKLTEEIIADALSMRDHDFVYYALAARGGTSFANVKKIMAMRAPKVIIALSWKSKLSMRFALRLQREIARIPHQELIYPRDGSFYPLTKDELDWQLDFVGIKIES